MSVNPLYVPPAPPPAASAPAEPTSTTVSPETANMVVAYHDTQLAITGIVKVIKEVNAVTQELQALEPLLELIVDRVRKEWLGTAKYRISKGYTAEKQAAALLAEARSKEPGPKIVLGRYVDGKLVVPPAPPISNTLDHLGDLFSKVIYKT